jgi:hypothetical protein
MYRAYKAGRAEKDPSEFWYKGEIGFFDFYIIPLAKKLKDCGVFGVSSDEYLSYAENNRKEWEAKGHEVVARMVEKCHFEDSEGRPPRRIHTAKDDCELLSKEPARNEAISSPSTLLVRSEESASLPVECEGGLDSNRLSCGPTTSTPASHLLETGADLTESATPASLSRGALEMSEKRFLRQLARVQPPSELQESVEQMKFL